MLVRLLLAMAISQSFNGREKTAATGTCILVRLLLQTAISPVFSGAERTDVQSIIVKMKTMTVKTNTQWSMDRFKKNFGSESHRKILIKNRSRHFCDGIMYSKMFTKKDLRGSKR